MARKVTHDQVRKAIVRIEIGRPKIIDAGRKISISAVAEEAGCSRALIHRDFPDLVDRIAVKANKNVRQQRDEKHEELKQYKERNKELRLERDLLKRHITNMQSKNATLLLENEQLKALLDKNSTVVKIVP
ncbi:TetR family transcriptional regulator [Thalassotalea marina]|uniref:Uncharacterized protein n=1 Tax=Thalassotalea marina TaxID=1673741 RepID=A0A919BSI1_9GAMM|nr:TetR family transcriptional regulator [Thalassotalea marina]GHG06990.1 hypothetical protein GCM10017161_40760 [Thalassotalea marina]